MSDEIIRGFKAFDTASDGGLMCRDMRYEVGGEYELDGAPVLCERGYHFCRRLVDCFRFYGRDARVCEVEAWGTVITGDDGKSVADHIRVVRELDRHEVLDLANTGRDCTGIRNSGYRNSGDWNSGDLNSGDGNSGDGNSGNGNSGYYNSGDLNSGDWNSGDRNSGHRNSGDRNSGDRNSGDGNSGDGNSGNGNSGHRNSGDLNSGHRNSGDRNSGHYNSGNGNSGHYNSGEWNIGYYNSGDCNSGDRNSGDWNATNFSSGVLCTEEPECLIFDRPSGMTLSEWRESEAAYLMGDIHIDADRWIDISCMTDGERAAHPGCEAAGGYLRTGTGRPDFAGWWDGLSDEDKDTILAIPNFDAAKWLTITGIDVAGDAR